MNSYHTLHHTVSDNKSYITALFLQSINSRMRFEESSRAVDLLFPIETK